MELSHLIIAALVSIPVIYVYTTAPIRDRALQAAQVKCQQLGLQFLDSNVHNRRLWLKRDSRGQVRLWRAFYFEFSSTGQERYQGRVIALGQQITDVQLDAHRMQ